jgi:ABC-2 type transport system permease protein
MVNPVADLMQQYRHALLGPVPNPYYVAGKLQPPDHGGISAAAAIGGYPELLIPIGIVIFLFVAGFWVFNRSAPHIAENL